MIKFVLGEIMKDKKITSQQLADRCGISKRTIDEYRNRSKEPSLSKGLKIADALEIDPHELIKEESEK